jgi:hypothetical protein
MEYKRRTCKMMPLTATEMHAFCRDSRRYSHASKLWSYYVGKGPTAVCCRTVGGDASKNECPFGHPRNRLAPA